MIPYFAKNGLIKEKLGTPSFVYVVVYVARLPEYEKQIVQPLAWYFPATHDKARDGCVGAQCYNPDGIPALRGDIVDKLAQQFGLWNMPFLPRKAGESYLETILKTFIWRMKGKIYVPDWIEFEGTYDDWRRVVEFYGENRRIKLH